MRKGEQSSRNLLVRLALNKQKGRILEQLRLDKEIDLVAVTDDQGNTLIHHSILFKDINFFNSIVLYQRDFLQRQNAVSIFPKQLDNVIKLWLQTRNQHHFTPFLLAAQQGVFDILIILYKYQVDTTPRTTKGLSPIHLACKRGHVTLLCYLVQTVNMSLQERDQDRNTGAHYACQADSVECLTYLFSMGLSVDIVNIEGHACLQVAARNKSQRCFYQLLRMTQDRQLSQAAKESVRENEQLQSMMEVKLNLTKFVFGSYFQNYKRTFRFLLILFSFYLPIALYVATTRLEGFIQDFDYEEFIFFGLMGLLLLWWLTLLIVKPAKIEKRSSVVDLLTESTSERTDVCYICHNFREAGVQHCYNCQRCVKDCDHHSNLIRSCVGKGNYRSYFFFHVLWLVCLLVFGYALADGFVYIDSNSRSWLNQSTHHVLKTVRLLMFFLFSIITVLNIIYCFLKLVFLMDNALLGITTNSRLLGQHRLAQFKASEQNTRSQSQSLLEQQPRRKCSNLVRWLC